MSHDTPVSTPRLPTPPGACDTHLHIYEPGFEMRASSSHPSQPATLAHYRELQKRLGLTRAVIVQPSAYGADNTCTLQAMARLGEDARGVAIVDPAASDAEIERLTQLGIRGIRYHMRGGVLTWDTMPRMAARVAAFGWHVQLQCESREIGEREAMLSKLPCDLVIDHMGRFDATTPADDRSWRVLLRFLATGRCWVKLSGPYYGSKSGPPHYQDKAVIAKALIRAAPERMVWATNWPHPSFKAKFPDEGRLLDLVADWTQDEALRRRILVDNAAALYRF
ncbi:MAG: amidohydrolase family protein [Betaproteobacteria bacterium]|nr:amidohydrolase family protein [Betaproteobacteria bacterium]